MCSSSNKSIRLRLLQAGFDYSGIDISGSIEPVLVYRSKLQQEHHNPQDTALALQQFRSRSNPFPQGPGSVLTQRCLIFYMCWMKDDISSHKIWEYLVMPQTCRTCLQSIRFSLFPGVNAAPVANGSYEDNLPSFINIQYRSVIPDTQFEFRSARKSPNVARRIVKCAVDFSYNPR